MAPTPIDASTLIVELAGVPGAGKTTAEPFVHTALRSAGWVTFDARRDGGRIASRTLPGRTLGLVPSARLRRALQWRVFLAYRLAGAALTVMLKPRQLSWLVLLQRGRPRQARTRQRRVLYWYLRMAGARHFYRSHLREGEAAVFDEGYLHRVVQLFSSPVDRADAALVRRYVRHVPPPDLLVEVDAPPAVCLDRVKQRGVWSRLRDISDDDLEMFLSNAGGVLQEAVDEARSRHWNLAVVANSQVDKAALEEVVREVVAARVSGPRTAPPRGGVWAIPRPRHFWLLARRRLGSGELSVETVDEALNALGRRRTGKVADLPLARRSSSVRVPTDQGELVVRGYPDHWPQQSLLHEHELLRRLEELGFPAPRLVFSPEGDTVVRVGDRRLAAFRFEAGRNLSGSYLRDAQAGRVHRLGGHLLADLHRQTAHLELSVPHHLAKEEASGGLTSRLVPLGELTSRNGPDLPDLAGRADEVRNRLLLLHRQLVDGHATRSIIHGDFGLHNLLVRRDGTAVVVDFELARRDWRLIDIVEALGSMAPRWRDSFLAGYVSASGREPDDWHLLAAAWEYHRLGGALRAWDSFFRRGTKDRLEVARRRLAEADRIAEEGIPL